MLHIDTQMLKMKHVKSQFDSVQAIRSKCRGEITVHYISRPMHTFNQ